MSQNLNNSQEILNTALSFAGELTDVPPSANVSEYREAALNYLNRIHSALIDSSNEFKVEMNEPFSWAIAKYPGTFVFEPSVDVDVTLVNGSVDGLCSTIPVNSNNQQISLEGRIMRVTNLSDIYRVVSHNAGELNFTIDLGYIQPDQVDINATFFQLRYLLEQDQGIQRLVSPFRIYQLQDNTWGAEVIGVDMSPMLREYPITYLQTRYPNQFSEEFRDVTDNSYLIQINTSPPDYARCDYDYIPVPIPLEDDPSSVPVLPLSQRMTLAYGVAYYLCLDKNDSRAQSYYQQTVAGMQSIVKAEKNTRVNKNWDRGRITPRQDQLRRRSIPWWWGRF